MEISYRKDRSVLTMYFKGELDECASLAARQTMEAIIYANTFKTLILDLKELTFMDSTGIGVLLGRYKTLKKAGIPIYIQNPSVSINKILQISGLYEIMPKI